MEANSPDPDLRSVILQLPKPIVVFGYPAETGGFVPDIIPPPINPPLPGGGSFSRSFSASFSRVT